ncbi:hypothetical protein FH972_025097 [Carpinus fangiana]|uniref:ER membrane protein complex subunit 1 n=1 Tax=Carpinus fangiana TaxID=176857 RepID=A0A5N6L013_9ROSI|nr:hypothetical protein FH972_025097 [Carpinus fangiana]
MRIFTALAAACLPTALAVYSDEAYTVDYHHALLGLPEASNTFFHPPYIGSKASLIYTLSEEGVLGAVNPRDGALVWRQILSSESGKSRVLRAGDAQDTLVTAVNDTVSTWSTTDGRLGWERVFQDQEVKDTQIVEHPTDAATKDVLVLLGGSSTTILRLDGASGEETWRHTDSSTDIPFKLAASGTGINYVSLSAGILKGYKIRAASLDVQTGKSLDQVTLSTEANAPEDVIFVGQTSAPIVAWTDSKRSSLKINVVGHKEVASFDIKSSSKPVDLVRLHASEKPNALPHFVVHYQSDDEHWADVFHINLKKGIVSKAYELPKLAGYGTFSACTVDANVYFTRVTPEETTLTSSASHGRLAKSPIKSFNVPGIVTSEALLPLQSASDVIVRSDGTFAIRTAVLLSSGDWISIRNGVTDWVRHESLASIEEASWGSFELRDNVPVRDLKFEEDTDIVTAFIHRIRRHVEDSGYLPGLAQNLPSLLGTWLENFVTPGAGTEAKNQVFGFKKLIFVGTSNGRILALQHGDQGRVLFNIRDPKTKDPKAEEPLWLRLSNLYYNGGARGTLDLEGASSKASILEELLPKHARLDIEVPTPRVTANPNSRAEFVEEISYGLHDNRLRGYQRAVETGRQDADLWTFSVAPGYTIVGVSSRLPDERVASIGKALGDRRVLYKYLNPSLVLVTATNAAQQSASFYLLDAVSGAVLHSANHGDVDVTRPINSVVSENWLAYSFTSLPSSIDGSYSSGAQFVMSELYESPFPNDRGPLGPKSTNFSSTLPSASPPTYLPHVISQAYLLPEEISALTVTQTQQGITSRHLVASLVSTQGLVSIPRQMFDPRRPIGKDPTGPQAMEEGLMRYAPFVDFDPKAFLSHSREVAGIKKILTVPSAMESTSLVFAYGLDVFGTRVAPSFTFDILGTSFNKVQLGLTVVCLVSGTLGVAPMVKRKMVDQLWRAPT